MRILQDAEIAEALSPEFARAAMRAAAVAAWEGRLHAPPRATVGLGDRGMTFGCGAVAGEWFGYRSYTAPAASDEDQVVVVHDDHGTLFGMAVGRLLGRCRVGAIGGVAIEALGPQSPRKIAMVGTGIQAWYQLWALPDRFRDGVPISVYSRREALCEAFAARARLELGLETSAVGSAVEAVRDADVVIMATSSAVPVIERGAIAPGAYVATLGPKQVGHAEFDPTLVADAAMLVCDSPAQVMAYDPPNVLVGTGAEDALIHLGAVLAGAAQMREGTRIFFSVGLAGTDVWLLQSLLGR